MNDFRVDGPGGGERSDSAAGGETPAPDELSIARSAGIADGDIIRGLRSGLIFSLAIWAMLFTVGTLVFS